MLCRCLCVTMTTLLFLSIYIIVFVPPSSCQKKTALTFSVLNYCNVPALYFIVGKDNIIMTEEYFFRSPITETPLVIQLI